MPHSAPRRWTKSRDRTLFYSSDKCYVAKMTKNDIYDGEIVMKTGNLLET